MSTHVLVIGGGISGLAAARHLTTLGHRVTLVEQSRRLGGKIRTKQFAGAAIETGAESFLARRPEAIALASELGLCDDLVHPSGLASALAVGNELHDMPTGTIMGIPAKAESAAHVLSAESRERIDTEPVETAPLLGENDDIAVGELVAKRYGIEVARTLVDPLIGGVYAGSSDGLSLRATIPALAGAAEHSHSLAQAVSSCLPQGPAKGRPVFASIRGGLSRLVDRLAATCGADVRLGATVRKLERTATGWIAVTGPTVHTENIEADAVVLAVPAKPASRLLGEVDAGAASEVGQLDYANVGIVTMAFGTGALPERSGVLVPATQGYQMKAATFLTRKWPHHASQGRQLVRVSYGRFGDSGVLQREDDSLIHLAKQELSQVVGATLPEPSEAAVTRWGGGLPQYGPGHQARIRRARQRLAPHPIALAGAAFDGVGIPACIASGTAAAHALAAKPGY